MTGDRLIVDGVAYRIAYTERSGRRLVVYLDPEPSISGLPTVEQLTAMAKAAGSTDTTINRTNGIVTLYVRGLTAEERSGLKLAVEALVSPLICVDVCEKPNWTNQ